MAIRIPADGKIIFDPAPAEKTLFVTGDLIPRELAETNLIKGNLEAVFGRMRIERQAEANRLRAEGAKEAQAIRDKTHVETQEILRKGREAAARITADAERRAAELLAKAHQKNPEFYQFWSSLQASKRVLKEKATLILSSDQLFFGGLASDAAETMTSRSSGTTTCSLRSMRSPSTIDT